MKVERSGEIYRFRLEHGQGFGYAQLLDFSDLSNISGWIIYVYNRFDTNGKLIPSLESITNKDIFMGPLTHCGYPARRGRYAWKYIGKTNNLLTSTYPTMKHLRGNITKDNNWANLGPWFQEVGIGISCNQIESSYEEIRNLEIGILDTEPSTVTKVTMKRLIDAGANLREYYDLSDRINEVCLVQIINTYYPLETTCKLLKLLDK